MANCAGTSSPPQTIYRAVTRYPLADGKLHFRSGLASCPNCGRVVATRPTKDNETILCRHSPAKQRTDDRRRRYAETYRRLGEIVRHPPVSTYAGPVQQTISVNAQYLNNVYSSGTGTVTTRAYNASPAHFQIEMRSQTTNNAGQYVYNINGLPTVAQTDRITLMVDAYAWSRWNETYTVSTNSYLTNHTIWTNGWNNFRAYQPGDVQREVQRARHYGDGHTYDRERALAERQQRALDLFQRVESERLATQTASERALGTLLGLLTEEQREEYARHEYFHVVGSKGHLYRIHKGSSGNIRRVVSRDEEGRGQAAFCVHSVSRVEHHLAAEVGIVPGHLPHEDHMIQQMLHLQIDEDEILAKANVHWGTRQPTDAELERFFAAEEANQRDRERAALTV